MAVTIPTGRITGAIIVLATMSQMSKKAPPKRPAAGIKNLLSPPIIMRHMCGTTRPTNPMVPVKHTMPAVNNDEVINMNIRVRSTLTPRLFARSSPTPITLRSQDFQISGITQIMNTVGTGPGSGIVVSPSVTWTTSSSHDALLRLPTIQKYASLTASDSAK